MSVRAASKQEIVMNFTSAPSADDLDGLARQIMASLPYEMEGKCDDLDICIEEFPDETVEQDMELGSPYELLALYHSGREIAPGIEKKIANDESSLTLYRRPVLDLWCETGEDLEQLLREVMIEELARVFEFTEDDVSDMLRRYDRNLTGAI